MTKAASEHRYLKARRLGLIAQDEAIALVRADSHVSRSEGLSPKSRVVIRAGDREVVATLYQAGARMLKTSEVGLSEAAWRRLDAKDGDLVSVRHPPTLESLAEVRRRIYGQRLGDSAFLAILGDIAAGRYAEAQLAAFVVDCAAQPLDTQEMIGLTRAMVDVGQTLRWDHPIVVDKHCVGGLPGNRTTPIVVAICTALGLIMPKTSSRAITSPAGTADTMETLAPVALDPQAMRRVVEAEGGCLVWGGAMALSPADDVLVRIGRLLDMDGEGQLVGSILSKKIAAGSSRVIIDIPVGPTAKIRTIPAADSLMERLVQVGQAFGLDIRCLITDGLQPVGIGIGPALEARDVLAVLQNHPEAPADLRNRAVMIAGAVIELAGRAPAGTGAAAAMAALADGRAWTKFVAICEAQGGMREPGRARLQRALAAPRSGCVIHINNRKLAKLAKLAGAPDAKAAGVERHVALGGQVTAGGPLLTVHSEAEGEMDYALDYAAANPDMIEIEA